MMKSENQCGICGEKHETFPAFVFTYPNSYYWLSEEQKNTYKITIDSDFCTIEYPDRTERFIRVVLKQKIAGSSRYLEYAVWAFVGAEDYENYKENFTSENHEKLYFGWLSNALPDYKFERGIALDIKTKTGNERPEAYPTLDFSHPFVEDFYNGITKETAEKRIHKILGNLPE